MSSALLGREECGHRLNMAIAFEASRRSLALIGALVGVAPLSGHLYHVFTVAQERMLRDMSQIESQEWAIRQLAAALGMPSTDVVLVIEPLSAPSLLWVSDRSGRHLGVPSSVTDRGQVLRAALLLWSVA